MIKSACSKTLPACYDIEIYRGDTWVETIAVTDKNDDPIDLTGSDVVMHVRKTKKSESFVLMLTIGSGISIGGDDDNEIIFESDITIPADHYFYDIEVTFSNGRKRTILAGSFDVLQDVTITN